MVSPSKRKGRASPHLFEYVFVDALAEAEAEFNGEATRNKSKKLESRNGVEWVNELKKTTQKAEEKDKASEEKEVFVVRDPKQDRRQGRGRGGRPRGTRGRGRGRAGTTQSPQGSVEPATDDRLPYGFPEEGKAHRQISEQSNFYLCDPDEKDGSLPAEQALGLTTHDFSTAADKDHMRPTHQRS